MTDDELDPIVERLALEARRYVAVDPDARSRLIDAIRAEGAPGAMDEIDFAPARAAIMLSRTRFAALAAGLVGVGVLVGSLLESGRAIPPNEPPQVVAEGKLPLPAASSTDTVMTFVFVANGAAKVSIVGDFNQWNADATPMKRIPNSNAWTATVSLPAGRHLYSFHTTGAGGENWLADPNAPANPDEGFGRASSVLLVGKGSAS
jgi:hypothetical protein